jgi:hypothetical protein
MTGKPAVCAGCSYLLVFPAGYDYVDISFSYGQTVYFSITCGTVFWSSGFVKTRFQRVALDPLFRTTLFVTRTTPQDLNYAWPRARPELNFGALVASAPSCGCFPPELFVPLVEQDGCLCAGVTYSYSLPAGASVELDAEFSAPVELSLIQDEVIVYNETGPDFYGTIEAAPGSPLTLALMSPADGPATVAVKWLSLSPSPVAGYEVDELEAAANASSEAQGQGLSSLGNRIVVLNTSNGVTDEAQDREIADLASEEATAYSLAIAGVVLVVLVVVYVVGISGTRAVTHKCSYGGLELTQERAAQPP